MLRHHSQAQHECADGFIERDHRLDLEARWIKEDVSDLRSRMGTAHAGERTVQKVWRTPNNNPIVEKSPLA